jgi:hypothetical protein
VTSPTVTIPLAEYLALRAAPPPAPSLARELQIALSQMHNTALVIEQRVAVTETISRYTKDVLMSEVDTLRQKADGLAKSLERRP